MNRPPVAEQLAAIVRRVVGDDLPVRIRAWDGSETGPAGAPVVVLRNRRALRRLLWSPGELGLARAYVTADLDVEGDIDAGFRRVWEFARARRTRLHVGPRATAPRGRRRGPARDRRPPAAPARRRRLASTAGCTAATATGP